MKDTERLLAVVSDLQQGKEEAAGELYELCREDIYYYIYKTVNDPELAADLVQDTFIEILQTIQNLREPAAFAAWSRQIAYHKCTAYFRKRHEVTVDENEDGQTVFDTIEEDREEFIPGAALEKQSLRQILHQIINDLPEEQRSAIMMRYFNELSVKEIAQIQATSEGTVKSRLNYARKAIAESVKDYEKKNGVKLHCAGIIPLVLWLLKVSGGFKTTRAVGTGAKPVGKFVAKKVIAGVAAAAVVTGGVVVSIISNDSQQREPVEQYKLMFMLSEDGSYYKVAVAETYRKSPNVYPNVVIPEEHDGLPVKEFVDNPNSSIKYTDSYFLTIPSSITYIEYGLLHSLSEVRGITVAEDNPIYHSVNNCLIETQTGRLILGCADSVIPDDGSVRIIGNSAFECKNIKKMTIPEGVTTIEGHAFWGCRQLEELAIPASVTQIEGYAFALTSNLCTINVESTNPVYHSANNCLIETNSKLLIVGCSNSIIPNDGSVAIIDNYAFTEREFTGITIPDSVTEIGDGAFSGCTALREITIPDSVTTIKKVVFNECPNLKIIVTPGNPAYCSANGYLIETSTKRLIAGTVGGAIPDDGSVTTIGYGMFQASDIESLEIPKTVTRIEKSVAFNCDRLYQIYIPDNVEFLGVDCFAHCDNLQTISLPSAIMLESGTFRNCKELTDIYIRGTKDSFSKESWSVLCKAITSDKATVHFSNGEVILNNQTQ